MKRRRDYRQFKQLIENYGITNFYHFTDRSNLESIIQNGGLYSWAGCKSRHIEISCPGGDDLSHNLDTELGIEEYVRVSLCKYHPMMYTALYEKRINNPVVLEIDTDILYIEGNKFSNVNALRTDSQIGDRYEDFESIHFKTTQLSTQFRAEADERKYFQAEILIKDVIPLIYIKNIFDIKSSNICLIENCVLDNIEENCKRHINSQLLVFLLNETIYDNKDHDTDTICNFIKTELYKLTTKYKSNEYDIAMIGYGDTTYNLLGNCNIEKLDILLKNFSKKSKVKSKTNQNAFLHQTLIYTSKLINNWINNKPDSNPPIVIHISPYGYNGVTDSEILELATNLKSYHTSIGFVKLYNVIFSNSVEESIIFPKHISELKNSNFGKIYYFMSSYLPNSHSEISISHDVFRVGLAFKVPFSDIGNIIGEIFDRCL